MTLDKETQMIAVEKVLEEKLKAEEFVKNWNACWYEQLLNAHFLPTNSRLSEADIRDMEKKYEPRYRLTDTHLSRESIGIPLVTETLIGNNALTGEKNINFECEFGRIDWFDMHSNKATRYFSFNNNGNIEFSKTAKDGKKQTLEHPNTISYDTSFNVLSSDFDISITYSQLTEDEIQKYKYDYLTISLKGSILIEKFNDIEIIRDLSNGIKSVRIVKKYDKRNKKSNASVAFEATWNSDDSLAIGAIAINLHKRNGKVNGTYRFDVSRKKGARANFYSRKGVRIDLTKNPELLSTANTLLLPGPNNQNSGDIIVSDFATSTQKAIAKNLSEKVINFDSSDFNMESLKQAEIKIIQMVKCIRGELPLFGLVKRIDDCLGLIDNTKQLKSITSSKALKIEL